MFNSIYKGRRVLITGHTGFKGSWLSAWLKSLGADITGYSLSPPTQPNHFDELNLKISSVINDVRDYQSLFAVFTEYQPEVVFHLAAQPSVLASYKDPIETFSSNVIGTVNVLEACRHSSSVRAAVIVTTDKCYENKEWLYGYRENDSLGGYDTYSASKACSELVTSSYRKSFFDVMNREQTNPSLVASVRAGNVVGGGDWTDDRLIPDAMRAAAKNQSVTIRNPLSKRPWQHVLEPLSGYLLLGQRLLEGFSEFAEAWNFGPALESNLTTEKIVGLMHEHWPSVSGNCVAQKGAPHEAGLLMLDSTKAQNKLNWVPVWGIDATIRHTVDWYRIFTEEGSVVTQSQIDQFTDDAARKGAVWVS
jgi:CDP-glucose 4,6-dehydratase